MRKKTRFIGLRVEESLYNFLKYILKIAPKGWDMSDLIRSILKRFWLEYMLGITKPSMNDLEKMFEEEYLKLKGKEKGKEE